MLRLVRLTAAATRALGAPAQRSLHHLASFPLSSKTLCLRRALATSPSTTENRFLNVETLRALLDPREAFLLRMARKLSPPPPKGGPEPEGSNNNKKSGEFFDQKRRPPNMWDFVFPLVAVLTAHMLMSNPLSEPVEISWQDFEKKFLLTGEVSSLIVDVSSNRVYVRVHDGAVIEGIERPEGRQIFVNVPSVKHFEAKLDETLGVLGLGLDAFPIKYSDSLTFMDVALAMLPILFALAPMAFGFFVMRRAPLASQGDGKNQQGFRSMMDRMLGRSKVGVRAAIPETRFKDVAGLGEAKVEIEEFVNYLKDRTKLTALGGRLPKGALLVGPPGTGKTLLARAVAGEANVPFFSVSGADFVEVFTGVGPARVRDLFGKARESAPCIIFIDEIDAVGRARSQSARNTNSERENTLNQLLVEMDGFDVTKGIVVLASTNRADILDRALLRPGRFDRQVHCDLPTYPERMEIARLYLAKLTLLEPVESHVARLAALTAGMSGAQIAAICNEAALKAARDDRAGVASADLDFAVARVYGGIERPLQVMQETEREVLAVHEAGHAVVSWFLKSAERVLQVSILPRANAAGGYTQRMPRERHLHSTDDLLDRLCMMLAGRAAEQVLLQQTTTSAHDDMKKVTELAYKLVCQFGMDARLGVMQYPHPVPRNAGRKKIADKTALEIDTEVDRIVRDAFSRAKALIAEHRAHVDAVAKRLLAQGSLTETDLVALLGPRAGADLDPISLAAVSPPSPTPSA